MSEKITIELVEKLQQRADVTYEEAKSALEKCDGDILEALISLEQEGKTSKPGGGGAYSTNQQANYNYNPNNNDNSSNYNEQDSSQNANQNFNQNAGYNQQGGPQMNYNQNYQKQESEFSKQASSVWKSFCRLVHKGNVNHFVISKNYEEIVRMPVNILIILLIIFNAAALILLIIMLFFGFKYSFSGPDLNKNSINNVMDSASETAEDIKQSAKDATSDNNQNGPDNNGQ